MAKPTGLLMANSKSGYVHTHTHAHTNTHVHACTHTYAHMLTPVHTFTHACSSQHMHAHPMHTYPIHMHAPTHMHVQCTPTHTYACTLRTCMRTQIHACTHMHMHHTPSHQGLAAFLSILVHCATTQVQQKWEDYVGLQPREQHLIGWELRGRGWGCPSTHFPGRKPGGGGHGQG